MVSVKDRKNLNMDDSLLFRREGCIETTRVLSSVLFKGRPGRWRKRVKYSRVSMATTVQCDNS